MDCVILLRFFFIFCLLTVFIIYFARPSFKKYLEAGIITEQKITKREQDDWPSLTICKFNNKSAMGWKDRTHFGDREGESWIDHFCGELKTIDDALACFQKGTFSLVETVINGTFKHELIKKQIDLNNSFWIEDVTEATYYGKTIADTKI